MTQVVMPAPNGVDDPRAAWLAFLASPAAPKRCMSVLALDGYLTGILVAPGMIPPSRWMANLWIEEEPVFDDESQLRSVLGALGAMSNALGNRIEQSLRRLEADRVCDYRPGFLPTEAKPSHAAVREWIGGFWKAMELVPAEWSALILDERTRVIVEPFVGFIDLGPDHAIELPDDIEERLDDAAAMIPRAILLLRKIVAIRAARKPAAARPVNVKIGRNDPCSCGSGQKFKRCCGSVQPSTKNPCAVGTTLTRLMLDTNPELTTRTVADTIVRLRCQGCRGRDLTIHLCEDAHGPGPLVGSLVPGWSLLLHGDG